MSMESRSTKSRRRKPPDVFPHLLTRARGGDVVVLQLTGNLKDGSGIPSEDVAVILE